MSCIQLAHLQKLDIEGIARSSKQELGLTLLHTDEVSHKGIHRLIANSTKLQSLTLRHVEWLAPSAEINRSFSASGLCSLRTVSLVDVQITAAQFELLLCSGSNVKLRSLGIFNCYQIEVYDLLQLLGSFFGKVLESLQIVNTRTLPPSNDREREILNTWLAPLTELKVLRLHGRLITGKGLLKAKTLQELYLDHAALPSTACLASMMSSSDSRLRRVEVYLPMSPDDRAALEVRSR